MCLEWGNDMTVQDWTPPPGFIVVSSQVSGIEIFAPAPPEEEKTDAQTFRCPQCHGITAYDAGDQQLVCPYCGYKHEVGARVVGLAADRFEEPLEPGPIPEAAAQRRLERMGWTGADREGLVAVALAPDRE